jgi:hypothetical protein
METSGAFHGPFGILCSFLVNVMASWYILWSLGTYFPILVSFAKTTLATLLPTEM